MSSPFSSGYGGETRHKRIVLSQLPLANVFPSGLNDTLLTNPVCPVRVRRCLPVPTSHKRIVSSQLPLANVFPSGLNDTLLTNPVCPVRVQRCLPVPNIPQANSFVPTTACQCLPVRTERYAMDLQKMSYEGA